MEYPKSLYKPDRYGVERVVHDAAGEKVARADGFVFLPEVEGVEAAPAKPAKAKK
jgi:hypothetical protein